MAGLSKSASKSSKKNKGKNSKKMVKKAEMSTDEFLKDGLEDDSDDDDLEETEETREKTNGDEMEEKKGTNKNHKQSLEKLKQSDPEFYEFLKNEDQELLDFNVSDDGDDDEDDDEEEDGVGLHKLPNKLEVASDEEEDEDLEEEVRQKKPAKKKVKVTMKMVERWSRLLRERHSLDGLHEAVEAFKAITHQDDEDSKVICKYKVSGSAVFNAVVRLCMADMPIMLSAYLKLPKTKDPNNPVLPSSCPHWKRVKQDVKTYLNELIQMIKDLSEPAILNVTLKHVHQMILYFASFPKTSRLLLKKLINVWSTGEETSRVLAFLSINKLTRSLQLRNMDTVLKKMYMEYVKNCKFTSPTMLPLINFMQRSLVEMLALDLYLSYQYAFVYIRQLAIHLRNAITTKKKETCQAVYNWQYIHSLGLWTRMLCTLHPSDVLQPLIYPLTQTIIGTIKLISTSKYYPLRFHCVKLLNMLTLSTDTFIPTLPFILEVFEMTDFNKKHKHISFKPIDFSCILKLSAKQLDEKTFRDSLIDQLYEHLMETLHIHAHSVGFPELALPLVLQLKDFMKKCKVANYTKQMKQILDKTQETSKLIMQRRRSATLSLANAKAVDAWETRSREEGTPLGNYYATWRKLRNREIQGEIAGKERISGDGMPRIERNRGPRQATEDDKKEFAELFDTDSEDDDDETRFLLKAERPAKKRKTSEDGSDSEEYSDFDDEELETLARSGSEGDDDEEDGDDDDVSDDEDGDDDVSDGKDAEDEHQIDNKDDDSDDSEIHNKEDTVEDFRMSDYDSD